MQNNHRAPPTSPTNEAEESEKQWCCRQCFHTETSEAAFATHLRSHFKGHRARASRKNVKWTKDGNTEKKTLLEKTNILPQHSILTYNYLPTNQLDTTPPINVIDELMDSNLQDGDLVNPLVVMPSNCSQDQEKPFDYREMLNLNENLTNQDDLMAIPVNELQLGKKIDIKLLQTENLIAEKVNLCNQPNEQIYSGKQPLQFFYSADKTLSIVPNSKSNEAKDDKDGGKTFKTIDINGKIVTSVPLSQNGGLKFGEEMLTCEICCKKFATSGYLYRHLRKHTGEFKCKICSMTFARKETWMTHRCPEKLKAECESLKTNESIVETKESTDLNNGIAEEQTKPMSALDPPQDTKKQCHVCSAILGDSTSLKRHMLRHDRVACYTCVYCMVCVQHRHSIRRHLRLYHADYEDEWNNKEFITSLQTEITKQHPGVCRKSKCGNLKKKTTQKKDEAFKVPVHRPKKDSVLGVTMSTDLKIELDCHLSQSAKSSFNDSTGDFLSNDRIIGTKDDSLSLISGFSGNFDEDMSHFQALSLPDILSSPSKGLKLDSRESSPMKGSNYLLGNGNTRRSIDLFGDLMVSPIKADAVISNKTDSKIKSTKFSNSQFKSFECKFLNAGSFKADSVKYSNTELRHVYNDSSENLMVRQDGEEMEDRSEKMSSQREGPMPSMPVILCDEVTAVFDDADEIQDSIEIFVCPDLPEPPHQSLPGVDYRGCLLTEESAPASSFSSTFHLEDSTPSPMQLIDTSNDFSFFVLG